MLRVQTHSEETVELCQILAKALSVALSHFILVLYVVATAATIDHFIFSKQFVSSKPF